MKNCLGCKYAAWLKTKSGKLHPSGDGKCLFPYKIPELPACKSFFGSREPFIIGGQINRKEELKNHCAYYQTIMPGTTK